MLVLISLVLRLSHKCEPGLTLLQMSGNPLISLREPSLYPVLNEAFPKELLTYPLISDFVAFPLDIIVLFVLFTHLYCFKFIVSVVCSIVFSASCFQVAQNSFQQLDFDEFL